MKKIHFKAKIEAGSGGGAYVLFPFDVQKEFGTKGKVPVQAMFGDVPYSGSLMKYGNPLHMLGVPKSIREQLKVAPGDMVEIELWRDEVPRTVEIPPPFKEAMKGAGVLTIFEHLSYTHQREYCRWITAAKKEETRLKRLDKAVQLLKEGVKTPDARPSRATRI